MPEVERFEIELEGGCVRGAFSVPAGVGSPMPAVMICRGVLLAHADAESLLDDLEAGLLAAGLAVARYEPRCAQLILEDFHAHSLAHEVADALGVFQWLFARPEVNAARVSVVGYSLGAIVAGILGRRVDAIDRLCLLAAVTPDHLAARMARLNGTTDAPGPARGAGAGARARTGAAGEAIASGTIDPHELPAAFIPGLVEVQLVREVAAHPRPILIVHGAADRFVPPEVALEFHRALEATEPPAQHVLVARANHTFSGETRAACIEQVARFLTAAQPASRQVRVQTAPSGA